MAVINDLSYETLIDIFLSLSTTDLGMASRVSRRWHEICEPVLYRKVDLSDGARIPTAIELLLRTLLSPGCERLASHVRVLNLVWVDGPVNPALEQKSIIDIIAAEVSRIGVSHSCSTGSQSAHIVLLMHLLPRLQRLVLQYEAGEPFNDIMHGIGPGPGEPICLAFHSLTHFSYEACYISVGVSSKTLLFLLHLPHLRTLSIEVMNDIQRDIFADVGGTSGVIKLTLSFCKISAASVALILSVPRALEYFSYCGDCVDGFVNVLLPLRASLTHLHLDFGDTFDPGQLLTLREWPVLRTLRCSPAQLLSEKDGGGADGQSLAEVLPVCIRHLGLLYLSDSQPWRDFAEVVDAIVQLLGQKWLVPALERLVVEDGSILSLERLRVACEENGVILEDDCSSWWSQPRREEA